MIPENCVGLFMIDNTLFADGSYIFAIVTLIEASIGFTVLWWALSELRAAWTGQTQEAET
jgi:hypothetical protein